MKLFHRLFHRLFAGLAFAAAIATIAYAATTLNSSDVRLRFSANQVSSNNISSPAFTPVVDKLLQFANGTGAGQYDVLFVDKRTLAASGSEDLDLTGTALKSAFNANIANAEIVGVLVFAETANTNDVVVGGASANGWFGMFGAANDVVNVKPGGFFADVAYDASGLGAVTAATADLLHIANSSSGTTVTYTIVILGRSA
jgi:hypothetical protein